MLPTVSPFYALKIWILCLPAGTVNSVYSTGIKQPVMAMWRIKRFWHVHFTVPNPRDTEIDCETKRGWRPVTRLFVLTYRSAHTQQGHRTIHLVLIIWYDKLLSVATIFGNHQCFSWYTIVWVKVQCFIFISHIPLLWINMVRWLASPFLNIKFPCDNLSYFRLIMIELSFLLIHVAFLHVGLERIPPLPSASSLENKS